MNKVDQLFLIFSSGLVWLMIPGLALFYGGLSQGKKLLNISFMIFSAMMITGIIWYVLGYSLAFSGKGPIIGNLHNIFMNNLPKTSDQFFALFQGMFAPIAVGLIAGSTIDKINLRAWLLFVPLWIVIVYIPFAHMIWGGGFLQTNVHALDFAGGDVVHISSGVSGLVLAWMLKEKGGEKIVPGDLTSGVVGLVLLWFGWFGFNAGSALAVNGQAAAAFINTNAAGMIGMGIWGC